jgi:methionyl-tRNA formyltransferase
VPPSWPARPARVARTEIASLRIAFAGTPDFAVPALHALVRSRHLVVGVLTQPDRPKGRGQQLAASPVKAAALAANIPVAQPQTLKTEAGREALLAWEPDVLVVVAYGLILPAAALAIPRLGCVNIHASLLPRWRGAAPIQRAILAGDEQTGTTIMLMDAGLDTGPMLLQRPLGIEPDDTGGSLHDKLSMQGAEAIVEALEGLESGRLQPRPQPGEGVTYASKLEKAEARIDWTARATDIERKVRAFNPWPIAETIYSGEQLRILRAKAEIEDSARLAGKPPGTILSVSERAILVQCGMGRLAVTEVQRAGRRPVSARDFMNAGARAGQMLGAPAPAAPSR